MTTLRIPLLLVLLSAIGENALSLMDAPRVAVPTYALGLPMVKKPFPGQRRPPCDPRAERAINGACWLGPFEGQKPPCGERMFDYEGKCFMASYDAPRPPTSEDPR